MKFKRGVFFSTDALVAVLVIFLVILIAVPYVNQKRVESSLDQDILLALSSIKVSEIDSAYVQSLISQGVIKETNRSVLEQIGEFYITNRTLAERIAQDFLQELDTRENVGIWFEDTLVASRNSSSLEEAQQIETSRQVISGIEAGENITGFSARAFLSNDFQSKYFYFGGYVGDGNLSSIVSYEGNLSSAEMELAIGGNFELYINGNFAGDFQGSLDDFSPTIYFLPISYFHSGENLIEFRGENLHVAGGFLKISYESSEPFSSTSRVNLPGISGIVNYYDGLSIPGELEELDINLNIYSNQSFFVNIGNVTVYSGSNTEESVILNNAELSSMLDYSSLSGRTTPVRIGLENVSYVINGTKDADVFSVTDLSGSMQNTCTAGFWLCCLFSGDSCSSEPTCTSCGGSWSGKLELAKQANYILIDEILNFSNNRVGLVGYKDSALNTNYHSLSNNQGSLEAKVDYWTADGNTCICCGINKAVQGFVSGSSSDKVKAMIVLSDGVANKRCSAQGTGNAKQDAILAACQAYQNYNITVHAVGFGTDADEQTLQSIASCGNGSYYFSDVDELTDLYQQIASDIIEGIYNEQTIEIDGELNTRLYPDSFIEFRYNKTENPFGLLITGEQDFSSPSTGQFSIPEGASVVDAAVVSYSGARWTDRVRLNSQIVYQLSNYGQNYTKLGDPYSFILPVDLIYQNNTVEVTTGTSPTNSTVGSSSNKIIYTLLKNATGFSPIVPVADGCIWNIQFEDNSNLTINIPSNYSGTESCYYTSSLVQYNINDAVQTAVYNLLRELDLNLNDKVDIFFNQQDLGIDFSEITGIPFPWSTEVQIRKWV